MAKTFTRATLAIGLLSAAFVTALGIPTAFAATSSAKVPARAPAQEGFAKDFEMGSEAPPPPEPPYPGSEKTDFAADASSVRKVHRSSEPEAQSDQTIERPKKIDEDGNYIYDQQADTSGQNNGKTFSGRPGITAPRAITPEGYVYDTTTAAPKFSGRAGVEPPISTTTTGEFRYKLEAHESKRSASFRLGVITPPSITNPDNRITFSQMYGSTPAPILFGDYEFKRLRTPVGRFGLKFGSGLFAASGGGHFKNPNRADLPDEHFTFLMFPNTLAIDYKFQLADKQVVVPYVEGGAGYFTFVEVRDDAKRTKFGGSPVTVAAGGLRFLVDGLDPHAIRQLDADYGINHLWLTLEVRLILGLESDVNFTSQSANAGFAMDF